MLVKVINSVRSAKSKAGIGTIKVVRKLLVNTSVNDWKTTGVVREWVYKHTNAKGMVEVEYFGVKLKIPGHDLGLAPGLLGGYYEKQQLTIYEKLATDAEVIIDAGANIGLYTTLGAKSMKSNKGKVFAFEPIPDNIKLLKDNIKLNSLNALVSVVTDALGEDNRTLQLHISEKSVGNHSAGGLGASGYGKVLEVQQTSIDAFKKKKSIKKVDLIKIDVEGYDGYVLKGALKTIASDHPALMVECIPKLLTRCEFDYKEFGKILFDSYDYCYSIDEANGIVDRIDEASFDKFLDKLNDANLVLIQRPEHKKIIEQFLGK